MTRRKNAVIEKTGLRFFPRALLLVLMVLLWGCSGEKNGTPARQQSVAPQAKESTDKVVKLAGDPVAGKKIYEKYCHFCHGMKGLGNGPVGIAISPHPADFVNDTKRMSKSDEELFKSITYGIKKAIGGEEMAMPRWKEILSAQQRWDVLAYVRKLEHDGQAAQKSAGKSK